jgi:hypothetical protein
LAPRHDGGWPRLLLTGIAYYWLTQDTPDGNFQQLRSAGLIEKSWASGAMQHKNLWLANLVTGAEGN